MFFSTNSSAKNGHEHDPFLKHQDFHLPISFFPFPSPFEVDDDHQFHEDLFLQQPHKIPPYNPEINNNSTAPRAIISISDDQQQKMKKAPRKRLCKKDRHSKICTARGQRDRRMRLSLPVARQFFGLQDMLGVDKGSKTVEWLLLQARPEILKLAKERNCSSLGLGLDRSAKSVCSSTSEIDEVGAGDDEHDQNEKKLVVKKMKSGGKEVIKKRVKKPIRKMMTKEMRKKARETARARTIEKNNQMQIRNSVISDDFDHHHHPNYTTNNFTKITSSISCFETGEESGATTQISYNFNQPAIDVEDQPMSCSQFGSDYQSSLEIMGNWSPSASTFNFLHHTPTLDLQDQEHEFGDSQFFG